MTSLSRYAPISIRCRTSGWVSRSSSRSSVAASSHCRSSRKSASGCSGRANTPMNRRNTSWKRLCASCGGSSGTGGWSPMMSFELRDEVDHQLAVRAQRLPRGVAPTRQLGVALAEELPDQALKRLRQRRIRDVALVLVELAGREQSARRHQRLVQLVDDRRLADAGIAGDQHQLRRAARRRPVRRRRAASRSRARARTASRE